MSLFLTDRVLFVFCSADYDKYSEDPEFKPASRHTKDLFEEVRIELLHSFLVALLIVHVVERF